MTDFLNLRKSKLLLFMLLAFFAGASPTWADELTVNDGTKTSNYVPIYGYYVDTQNTTSEFIIPADRLENLEGATISQMTFYLSTPVSGSWEDVVFEVYLKEVTATTYASATANTEGTNTVVYTGSLDGSKSTMVVPFSSNYVYGGGNLLVGFKVTTAGYYANTYFSGETFSYGTYPAFHSDGASHNERDNFLPKVTFEYTAGVGVMKKPKDVTASNILMNSATISWTAGGSETSWEVSYSTSADEPAADGSYTTVNTNSYELTGLTSGTTYYVYVRAVDGDNKSKWSKVYSFTPGVLTINNTSTTTNNYVPIYGNYMDAKSVCQFVLPKESLTALNGSQITKIVFYGSINDVSKLESHTFEIYMGEVAEASIAALADWTTLENVYTGSLTIADGKMTITLADGFDYNGENLLIGLKQTDSGNAYSVTTWTGVASTGASLGGYGTSVSQQNFLPQMSFYYAAQTTTVKKPKNLAASEVATTTAVLGWTDGEEGLTAWQIAYSTDADFAPDTEGTKVAANANPFTLTELTAATTYYAYVRAKKGEDYSKWSNKVEFTTLSAAPVMELSTTSISFGLVSDAAVQAQTFTVGNTGGVDLTAFSVKPSNEGFAVSDVDGNELPQTIGVGQTLTVKVVMNALGNQSADLVITGNNVAEQRVALTGYMLDNTKILETFASASSVSRWTVGSGWTFSAANGAYSGTSSRVMTSPKLTVAEGNVLALNVKLGWDGGSLIVEGLDADGNTVYSPVTYNSSNGGLNTSSFTLLTISDMPTTVAKVKLTGYYAYINVFNGFTYANDPQAGFFSNSACTTSQTSPATKAFGFAAEAQTQLYYIKNTGNGQVDLTIDAPAAFTAEVDDNALTENEVATLTITMPATEGLHDGTITVTAKNHDNDAVLGSFEVNANGAITGSKNNVVLTAFPAGWQNNNWTISNGAARIWSSTASDLITTTLKVTEGEKLLVEACKYYSDSDSQLSYSYSTDNGTTWSEAVSLTDQLTTSYKVIAISDIPAGNVLMKFTGTYTYIRQIYGFEAVAEPIMTFAASDYNFGMINASKTTEAYTVKNEGTAALNNLSVSCDNPNFTVAVADNATSIAANSEVTFTVTLNTTANGTQNGTVTISGDGVESKTFNVKGYVADGTKIFETFTALPDRWTNTGNYWTFSASGANTTSSSSKLETPKIKIAEGEKLAISAKQQYPGSYYYVTINGSSDNGATWTAYTKKLSNDVLNNTDYTVVELDDIPTTVNKLQLVGYYVYVNGLNGFSYDDNDPKMGIFSDADCTVAVANTTVTNNWGFISENKTATYYIKNTGTGTLTLSKSDAPAGFTATLAKNSLTAGESTSLTVAMAYDAVNNEGYHAGDVVLTAKNSNNDELGTFTVTSSGVVAGAKADINFATLDAFPAGWEATNWSVTSGVAKANSWSAGTLTTGTYSIAAGEALVIEAKGNNSSSYYTPSLTYQYSVDGGEWTTGTSVLTYAYSASDYQLQAITDIPVAGDVKIKFTGSYIDIRRMYGYTVVAKPVMALDKADDYDFGMQTAEATYVITVTNNGTAAMTGLKATLASGTDYSAEVSRTDLAVNETATVTVTQKFDAAKGLASLADVLTISADDIAGKTINLSGKTRDASKWYVDFAEGSIPSDFVENGSWSAESKYASTTSSTESSLITQPITLAAGEKIQFEAKNPYSGSLKVRYSVNGGISWSDYTDYTDQLNASTFTALTLDLENTEAVTAVVEFCGRYYVYLDNIYGGVLNNEAPMVAVKKASTAVINGVTEAFGSIFEETQATYTITNIGNGTLTITSPVATTGVATAAVDAKSLAAGESATLTITMPVEAPYGAKEGAVTIETSLGNFVINYTATTMNPNALNEDFASNTKPTGWYFGGYWEVSGQEASQASSGTAADLITQKLTVAGESDALTFQAARTSSNTAPTFNVYTSTDRETWTEVDLNDLTLTTSYQTITVNGLEAGDYYLKITGARVKVDNFIGWTKKAGIEHDLYVSATSFPAAIQQPEANVTISATATSLIAAEEGLYAKLFIDDVAVDGAVTETVNVAVNETKTFSVSYTMPATAGTYVARFVIYNSSDEELYSKSASLKVYFSLDEDAAPAEFDKATYSDVYLKHTFVSGWNTVCLPFEMKTTDLDQDAVAYQFTGYEDEELIFTKKTTLEAGKPYVIYLPILFSSAFTFTDVKVTATEAGADTYGAIVFQGSFAPMAAGELEDCFGMTADGKIMKASASATMKGFRGYFKNVPAGARTRFVDSEDEVTAIRMNTISNAAPQGTYNMQGQKVEMLKKGGLYIINGKKQVMK